MLWMPSDPTYWLLLKWASRCKVERGAVADFVGLVRMQCVYFWLLYLYTHCGPCGDYVSRCKNNGVEFRALITVELCDVLVMYITSTRITTEPRYSVNRNTIFMVRRRSGQLCLYKANVDISRSTIRSWTDSGFSVEFVVEFVVELEKFSLGFLLA